MDSQACIHYIHYTLYIYSDTIYSVIFFVFFLIFWYFIQLFDFIFKSMELRGFLLRKIVEGSFTDKETIGIWEWWAISIRVRTSFTFRAFEKSHAPRGASEDREYDGDDEDVEKKRRIREHTTSRLVWVALASATSFAHSCARGQQQIAKVHRNNLLICLSRAPWPVHYFGQKERTVC